MQHTLTTIRDKLLNEAAETIDEVHKGTGTPFRSMGYPSMIASALDIQKLLDEQPDKLFYGSSELEDGADTDEVLLMSLIKRNTIKRVKQTDLQHPYRYDVEVDLDETHKMFLTFTGDTLRVLCNNCGVDFDCLLRDCSE